MNETLVSIVGVLGAFIVVLVVMYRVSPGLSEAMSAWAKKQEDLSKHRLVEEWAQGFQEGQELERQKREGVK